MDLIRIILKKTNEKVDEKKVESLLRKNLLQITDSISNKRNSIDFEIIFKDKLSRTPRGKLKVVTSKV